MSLKKIDDIASIDGTRICLIDDDVEYSYREISEKIGNIAKRLASISKPNDKVLINLEKPLYQLLFFLGAWKAGLVSIFSPPNSSKNKINQLIKKIQPQLILDSNFRLPKTESLLPRLDDNSYFLGALSSGTTGDEKIIWRDYSSWKRAFPYQSEVFNIEDKDRLFLVGDFSYTANLNSALHILTIGGSIVHTSKRKPNQWVNIIEKNKVDTIFMVPTFYQFLVEHYKGSISIVKSVVTAGSKLSTETARKMFDVFPNAQITEYYGASELGHVSYISGEDILLKRNSVGKVFPKVNLWIEDSLIWVVSPYVASFYRPKATAGDMGFLDSDGFLYLNGRQGNVINRGGEKILPLNIERKILTHPKVDEAIVLGIPDKKKGQEIAVVIKGKETLTLSELKSFLSNQLEVREKPKRVLIVDTIPLKKNGKINRKELIKLIQN